MSKYLFIESREPFESVDSQLLYSLAPEQAVAGHEVTVFLVQNGVLLARCGSKYEAHLVAMRAKGVRMLADVFRYKSEPYEISLRVLSQVSSQIQPTRY